MIRGIIGLLIRHVGTFGWSPVAVHHSSRTWLVGAIKGREERARKKVPCFEWQYNTAAKQWSIVYARPPGQ